MLAALANVQATADTRVAVEYGAPARVRALGERFRMVEGYGFGMIANSARLVDEAIGVDLQGFDSGIVVGQAPRWGAALWGDYDVAAVDAKFRELGIDSVEQGGGTLWTSGKDFEIALADGPFTGVVPLNQFNDVRTAAGSFAYGPARAGVEWVTDAGDTTLADDDALARLALCLGDVVAARIEDGIAAGVRGDGREVACVGGDQGAVEKALDGPVPSTRQPWDSLLPGVTVEDGGGLVRVVAPGGDEPAGRMLQAMMKGDLKALA